MMNEKLLKELNPHIRFVNFLQNCNNENHHVPWRQLYDYEILFVVSGSIFVKTKTETYEVPANHIHIMRPDVLHTRYFAKDSSCSYYNAHADLFYHPFDDDFSVDEIYIKPIRVQGSKVTETASLKRRKRYEGIRLIPVLPIRQHKQMTKLFQSLYKTFSSVNNDLQFLELKLGMLHILRQILIECEAYGHPFATFTENRHEEMVSLFIDYVKNNYGRKIDLAEVTHGYGISQNHFTKIFKQSQNISPNSFLIDFRIDTAKNLLKSGKYYIWEVAQMVGYDNVYYFSRLFKQKEGISPQIYLKRLEESR